MSLRSYTSSFNLGHKELEHLFDDCVSVQEKIDGSQFSFGKIDGVVQARSKKVLLDLDGHKGMFAAALEQVKRVAHLLPEGYTFRGEYLQAPKHNTLAYNRIPNNHIMLFDIDRGIEDYMSQIDIESWAVYLDFEAVPRLYYGIVKDADMLKEFMSQESALGGPIEGVVIKNYRRYNYEKKLLLGKFVSEEFKETNARNWKSMKVTQREILDVLTEQYTTDARWRKAVQHLTEAGELEQSPRDIGKLIHAIPEDIRADSEEEIKQALFDWAWPTLQRQLTKGFPQWYKEQLLERQFEHE